MVVQVFNPVTQQAEVGISLGVQSQSALHSQQKLHGVLVSKNYNKIMISYNYISVAYILYYILYYYINYNY